MLAGMNQEFAHKTAVFFGGSVESPVEHAEKSALRLDLSGIMRFENRRAQGRGQNNGHHHRKQHGGDNGNGELTVNDAGGSAKKGHGHEHRGQNHGDAHKRAGDLAHGLACGFFRRKVRFLHDAFHVFNTNNRVVNQEADGKNHPEHGQSVDAEAKRGHDSECAQKNNGHRDGRNDRGPEVLQEQVHDEKDKDNGLDQGRHHFLDGDRYERRAVDGLVNFQAFRQKRLELLDFLLNPFHNVQSVRAGRQADGQSG